MLKSLEGRFAKDQNSSILFGVCIRLVRTGLLRKVALTCLPAANFRFWHIADVVQANVRYERGAEVWKWDYSKDDSKMRVKP